MKGIQEKSKFLWVGNWPAVDFINTDIVVQGKPVDLFDGAHDVTEWIQESRLCEGVDDGALRPKKHLLDEARGYRALLRHGIADLAGGGRLATSLINKTNAYLRRDVASPRLDDDGENYRIVKGWRFHSAGDYMAPVAESFAKLVTEADLDRIRKCKNPECILYFYDISKGGRRSWCSLDICGNKLRMAASRLRRSELHQSQATKIESPEAAGNNGS